MALLLLLLLSLVAAAGGFAAWSWVTMEINYRRAQAMGIPLVRLPVDPMNVLWMTLEGPVMRVLDMLPISLGDFGRYSRRGWHFKVKAAAHLKYGPAWALVTPQEIYVNIADADAIHNFFTRKADFLRQPRMYKILEVYGPCISTAEWSEWPRHRKIIAAHFNESTMKFVWNEGVKQARAMVAEWIATSKAHSSASPISNRTAGDGCIRSVADDTCTLSLNILAATGFKRSYGFRSVEDPADEKLGGFSYRDALAIVLDNCILLLLIPYNLLLLPLPFIPASWKKVGKAAASFKRYMMRMLDEETASLASGGRGAGGLMTSFVRAMDKQSAKDGLSVEEIFGNIFVVNFAGHFSTANTLAFTVLLLAAHPEVQEWLREEVRGAVGRMDGNVEDAYGELYPQLIRVRAILLETLRLYPPIISIPKWSNSIPQPLPIGDRTIILPPNTAIFGGVIAMHTHPRYWGDDALTWRPSRWITKSSAGESLITPQPNTYFPWSDGPQNCPGERFVQVEFVSAVAALIAEHQITATRGDGETWAQVKERILDTVADCGMELVLRMKDADRVKLRCESV